MELEEGQVYRNQNGVTIKIVDEYYFNDDSDDDNSYYKYVDIRVDSITYVELTEREAIEIIERLKCKPQFSKEWD